MQNLSQEPFHFVLVLVSLLVCLSEKKFHYSLHPGLGHPPASASLADGLLLSTSSLVPEPCSFFPRVYGVHACVCVHTSVHMHMCVEVKG